MISDERCGENRITVNSLEHVQSFRVAMGASGMFMQTKTSRVLGLFGLVASLATIFGAVGNQRASVAAGQAALRIGTDGLSDLFESADAALRCRITVLERQLGALPSATRAVAAKKLNDARAVLHDAIQQDGNNIGEESWYTQGSLFWAATLEQVRSSVASDSALVLKRASRVNEEFPAADCPNYRYDPTQLVALFPPR